MKILHLLTLLGLLLGTATPSIAQEKYSKVKVYVPEGTRRQAVLGELEIDHYESLPGGAIVSDISATALAKLKRLSLRYEILVDDVAQDFEESNRIFFSTAKTEGVAAATAKTALAPVDASCTTVDKIIPTPSLFSVTGLPTGAMGGFYTLAEINARIDEVVQLYPTIAQKINLGTSIEGRTIWAVKISDNVAVDENEPEVLYTGLQHAREAIGGTSLVFFIQYLAQNYNTDERVRSLVDSRELYIVPCVNPDGYEYNRSTNPNGGGGWRKNRRNNNGSYGVDLNRNYGIDWGNCAGASSACGSSSKSSDTYWGTAAFSEPETQAIRNLVLTHHFVASLDQHSYGPYYSLPFGRPSLHTMTTADQKFYTYVPALMGKYNGMRAGNSPQTVNYEVAGGLKDWLLLGDVGTGTKGKVYGMTGEGGNAGGISGTYGSFWAPASGIIGLCKGMCFQNLQLAFAAGSCVEVQDRVDIAVTATSGSFPVGFRRVGLQNAPVTLSLVPIEGIASVGAPVAINSLPNYYDTVAASIPYSLSANLVAGGRIRYAWKVETGGVTTYDTVIKFFKPVTLLADDMEGNFATNWGGTSNLTSTAGKWAFTTTLAALAGTKSMTESPSGNYTANSTRVVTYNKTLNLADATAAYLTFMTKHRAENFRDKLQIQVSVNGTTWVPICGKYTVQQNNNDGSTLNNQPALTGIRENWTQELFDLSAYKGQSALRLRFSFTSDGDGSGFAYQLDDGFYIDNLKVVKTSAVMSSRTAPDFVNVSGKLLTGNRSEVEWETLAGDDLAYFEVERSTDGSVYAPVGKVSGLPPFHFTDHAVQAGNNYYRIRQVANNGKVAVSNVVNLVYNPGSVNMSVYPNPVTKLVQLKMNSPVQQIVNLVVTDMQGRNIYQQRIQLQPGSNGLKIDATSWAPQVYLVKITGTGNEQLVLQKIIKQ